MSFWAYMLHCRGGAYYTGHTDDLEKRISEHQGGLIEGFTSARLPVELVWSQEFPTRIEALEAEQRIKGWSRKKKMALIRGDWDEISMLAKAKNGASTGSARTGLVVSGDVVAALLEEAAQAAPEECCGLLLGHGERIALVQPAANVADDRTRRFEIDPYALLAAHKAARDGGPDILGYYHSHPDGHPVPSATDCEHASGDGRVWAIVAGGEVTFWRDSEQGFEPVGHHLI
ncbi:MAG: Mov34/MPN/PAD-1 family protein [Novosphingobium sp.]|nr:Mov34/MPN/PAD-1 family protein [Novosphingobium sp.]